MFSKNALDTVTSLNGSHSTLENWKLPNLDPQSFSRVHLPPGLPQTGQQQGSSRASDRDSGLKASCASRGLAHRALGERHDPLAANNCLYSTSEDLFSDRLLMVCLWMSFNHQMSART